MKSKKVRICFLLPSHWSANYGGAEHQTKILLEAMLAHEEFEIIYITRNISRHYVPNGYQIEIIRSVPYSYNIGKITDAVPLLSILKRIRPDVIYQRVGCAYTGFGAFYAKKSNSRLVWHISSDMNVTPYIRDKNSTSNLLSRYIEKKVLEYGIKSSTSIIAQTRQQAELLYQHYGRWPNRIIPNYQPIPDVRNKNDNLIKVVWISNFKPMKRPGLFIGLAQQFKARKDIEFIMIGRMDNSNWCRTVLGDINNSAISYLGEKTQDEVNEILAYSHILVNTSEYEGFPNTFIQAWMNQLPVISLSINPDNVLEANEVGIYCGTYTGLCDSVKLLADDHQIRRTMGQRAREYAVMNHSKQNVQDVIQELIGHR